MDENGSTQIALSLKNMDKNEPNGNNSGAPKIFWRFKQEECGPHKSALMV